jgi:small subunit ribosomal protein S3Ae
MAVGKNKKLKKKGNKKKAVDPFSRKDWFDIKAPSSFTVRQVGKTMCNRTVGKKTAKDNLMGRVFEVCLADLNDDEDQAYRKMRLRCEDVQGKNVLTQFCGMDMTRDKLCSLTKRWQSLIECHVDVATTDGYLLRLFAIAFTKKRANQVRKASYAQSAQAKMIRAKMAEIMTREAETSDLKELVAKFVPESIGKEIERVCHSIYPLQNVFVRKCKVLKAPRFDLNKLMEMHSDIAQVDETGAKVERKGDFVEPEVLTEV